MRKFWAALLFAFSAILLIAGIASAEKISMTKGWSLKNSLVPITTNSTFKNSTAFTSIWAFDQTTANWKLYLPAEADGGKSYATTKSFGFLETIQPGQGFWVNSVSNKTVEVTGSTSTNSTLAFVNGWNLAGLKSNTAMLAKDTFANQTNITSVWKWVGSKWAVFVPSETDKGAAFAAAKGFAVIESIFPDEGFWVNSNGEISELPPTPPVVAGTVTYPNQEVSSKKLALYDGIPDVEMPPMPGVPVIIYSTNDTEYSTPLGNVTTDENGNYAFTAEDFSNGTIPDGPIVARAQFPSPLNSSSVVAVSTPPIDPSDEGSRGQVKPTNPLSEAVGRKIKSFVEDTFKVSVTKEILAAAKAFIDAIADALFSAGLTVFEEDDVTIGVIEDNGTQTGYNASTGNDLADRVIDKGTGGLVDSMEQALVEQAEQGADLGAGVQFDQEKGELTFRKFFASLGFNIQAGADGSTNGSKVIAFIPAPAQIPEDALPGEKLFNDRAFRLLDPSTLADEVNATYAVLSQDPGFLYQLRDTLNRPMLSANALDAIKASAKNNSTTTLTAMTAAVKKLFQWKMDAVSIVNGVPVFGNGQQTPPTGATVLASELLAGLTGQLAENPQQVAADIASRKHFIMDLADKAMNEKLNQIWGNPDLDQNEKQQANEQFLNSLQTFEDFKALVQASNIYQGELDRISRQIYAALDPNLYGKALSPSTQLKVKTSFLLLNMMFERDYLIDSEKGWIKVRKDNLGNVIGVEPNFSNTKHLEPVNGTDIVTDMVKALLEKDITTSTEYLQLTQALMQLEQNFQIPDEFQLNDNFKDDILGQQQTSANVNGTIYNFDGTPFAGTIFLKYFNQNGAIEDFGSIATGSDGTFQFTGAPTNSPAELRFAGTEFIYPFFIDGFADTVELFDIYLPQSGQSSFAGVPGITMWADQASFDPGNPSGPCSDKLEGVDFSNFNSPNPFIIPNSTQQCTFDGLPDMYWTSASGLVMDNGAQIAAMANNEVHVKGLLSPTLADVSFTAAQLAGNETITLKDPADNKEIQITLNWVNAIGKPAEDNAVYVIRDGSGSYFFVEVRFWDKDAAGDPSGELDMGFAELGQAGKITVPGETFLGTGGTSNFIGAQLYVGDWFDLDGNMRSAPIAEPYEVHPDVMAVSDIRWLAAFYEAYWQNQTDWGIREAALANSDKALSVVNNATLSTIKVDLVNKNATVSPVNGTVVTNIKTGDLFLVITQNSSKFVVGALSVSKDYLDMGAMPADAVLGNNGEVFDTVYQLIGSNQFNPDPIDNGTIDNIINGTIDLNTSQVGIIEGTMLADGEVVPSFNTKYTLFLDSLKSKLTQNSQNKTILQQVGTSDFVSALNAAAFNLGGSIEKPAYAQLVLLNNSNGQVLTEAPGFYLVDNGTGPVLANDFDDKEVTGTVDILFENPGFNNGEPYDDGDFSTPGTNVDLNNLQLWVVGGKFDSAEGEVVPDNATSFKQAVTSQTLNNALKINTQMVEVRLEMVGPAEVTAFVNGLQAQSQIPSDVTILTFVLRDNTANDFVGDFPDVYVQKKNLGGLLGSVWEVRLEEDGGGSKIMTQPMDWYPDFKDEYSANAGNATN